MLLNSLKLKQDAHLQELLKLLIQLKLFLPQQNLLFFFRLVLVIPYRKFPAQFLLQTPILPVLTPRQELFNR